MAITRTKLIAGVMLGGLAGGITLGGAMRNVQAGPGDPPVIVLPSARAALKQSPVVAQAEPPLAAPPLTAPPPVVAPRLEMLPPPAELASPAKSTPAAAPPLLVPPEKTLRTAPLVPTLTPKEVAPTPHQVAEAQPSQGPTPSALAPPGENTMPLRTANAAAALTAMLGTAPIQAAEPMKSPMPMEKITDYAKVEDVKSLKEEIEALRKQLETLNTATAQASKATDVKALKEEVELLRKDIAGLAGKAIEQPKATDLKTLKDEVASLKKDIAALSAKPADTTPSTEAKAMKDEVDAIRKDVQTLSTFLRETLEGKVDKGFTHDGVVKRLQKLDESIESLAKKVQTLDTKLAETSRVAGSSPLGKVGETALHGLVRVVNEYPVEIAIVVNGASHRLEPNSRKDIAVPSGSFKYQLLTSGGAETERSIKENETVTLTIR